MHDVQYYKSIFDKYGGMMYHAACRGKYSIRSAKLIADGYVGKIRRGYYRGLTRTISVKWEP